MQKRRRLFSAGIFLALFIILIHPPVVAEGQYKDSVVRIEAVRDSPDYARPWQMRGQSRAYGSGAIIKDKRILTNAHVVADQTFVQVKRADQAQRYVAHVEVVSHEADLALLTCEDDEFFEGTKPLEIGELPRIRDKVAVYGFPVGGTELAITEGVVSRVEILNYSHSGADLLCVQIDAPINPGSSGGPVIVDGRIAGVAFQGVGGAQNIGYMVPPPVIHHFFDDIKDGSHDGTPVLAIAIGPMENPDIRARYKMPRGMTGVLVTDVYPASPAKGILEPEDVLLEIDGFVIENNGTVEFRKGERTSLGYAIQRKQIGDNLDLLVLRDGKKQKLVTPLTIATNMWQIVPRRQFEITPTYYIVAGLVVCPLSFNLLSEMGGQLPREAHNYFYADTEKDREQIVTITQVLSDEVNVGYQDWRFTPLETVNGREIKHIRDVVEAIESNQEPYHVIITETKQRVILDREKVQEGASRILERYRVPSDRSPDLMSDGTAGAQAAPSAQAAPAVDAAEEDAA